MTPPLWFPTGRSLRTHGVARRTPCGVRHDDEADSLGPGRQGTPHAVGHHSLLLLDVIRHRAVQSPGEGVQDRRLPGAITPKDKGHWPDAVRPEIEALL